MQKEWIISNTDTSKCLIKRLLEVRNITKEDEKEFLKPLSVEMLSPNSFTDMEKSVKRLSKAIDTGEKIVIYGDFDADGITSTSIMYKTLSYLKANIDYYIPDRENDGHGMNSKALVKIMTQKKPKVLITVDCGISNHEEVQFLNSFGIDVIITDHHEAPENLPPAFGIIDAKAPNGLIENIKVKQIKSLTSLAGCGVALKVSQALLSLYKQEAFINELIPLAAVGTIADIVPLIGENRYIVAKGLQLISEGKHYGLSRLLEHSGYKSGEDIKSDTIAFIVAPRINATGRLDNVDVALKLLLSDNKTEIEMAVQTLNELNKVRQNLCDKTFKEAQNIYEQNNNKDTEPVIVVEDKNWNVGIIGIVASRLVETYGKPAFVMTHNTDNNEYRCSARSINGINMFEIITENMEMFLAGGGHAMAGGFSFDGNKVNFDTVKNTLNKTVSEMTEGKELKPILNIDLELDEKDLDISMVDEISKLEPFGAENPKPIFAVKDFVLKEKRLIGENKNHLQLKIMGNNIIYNCVWWSHDDIDIPIDSKIDLAFSPQINSFNNTISLQLIVEDIHSDSFINKQENQDDKTIKIYDHREKTEIIDKVNDYVRTSKLDISVFAECPDTIKKLKDYKFLNERIVARDTIKKTDSIMFFDYPASDEISIAILQKTKPHHIHLMPCKNNIIDERKFLKTIAGMIKFACNNKDGIFDIEKSAVFLGVTNDCIENILQIFEECEMINLEKQNEQSIKINFIKSIELSNILSDEQYSDFRAKLTDISNYKNNFTISL